MVCASGYKQGKEWTGHSWQDGSSYISKPTGDHIMYAKMNKLFPSNR